MSKNVLREIRNRVNAETRMQAQFKTAQEKAMKQVEEEISSLFEGKEEVNFRFDAFSMWGMNNAGPAFWKNFPVASLQTDDWYRAVWSLSKADALAIAKYVEEWNAPWEFDQNEYYNAYHVSFSPASGSEHTISVKSPNGHSNDSWQWNG